MDHRCSTPTARRTRFRAAALVVAVAGVLGSTACGRDVALTDAAARPGSAQPTATATTTVPHSSEGGQLRPLLERIETYCRLIGTARPSSASGSYWADRRASEHRALFLAPTSALREASEIVATYTRDVIVTALDGRDGPGTFLAAAALPVPVEVAAAHGEIRAFEESHCGPDDSP